jgi:hypothetical protein
MTDLQTRKKSMKAKEMYTWLVATDHLSDTVRDNILKSAMRMLAQNHKLFTEALDETAKGHIPSHISIGKASSEDFPLSFIIWLKSKGIDVDSLESLKDESVFFLVGDADDPATEKSFRWGVFVYLQLSNSTVFN